MKVLTAASLCALFITSTPTMGATIYRCADQAGHLTFTRHGCSTHETSQVADAVNPTPSSGRAVPLAKPKKKASTSSRQPADGLTVVGERDDGCGNLISARERRKAVIARKVMTGMNRSDIESMFGTPDKAAGRDGRVQYRYSGDKETTRTINFDEHGCVRGKR